MSSELSRFRMPAAVAVVACVALLACAACGSPESSGRAAVILEPERIPHQESGERAYRDVEIVWSDTLDLDVGTPTTIRLLPDTTILIGDGGYQAISHYDRSGALLRRFGSPGPGPGEFEDLRAVIPLDRGRVIGIDGTARASVFGPDGLVHSTSLGSPSWFVAPFGGGFVTASPLNSPVFRLFDDSLAQVTSFGDPLFPVEQGIFGTGMVVDGSTQESDAVAFVALYAGFIVAYYSDGAPKYSFRTIDPPSIPDLRMTADGLDGVTTTTLPLNGDGSHIYVFTNDRRTPFDFSVDVYDSEDGAYLYTMRHPSTECAYRDIRGDLGIQVCSDMRLILQKFSVTE